MVLAGKAFFFFGRLILVRTFVARSLLPMPGTVIAFCLGNNAKGEAENTGDLAGAFP